MTHKRYMHYFERFKGHADSHTREKAKRCVLSCIVPVSAVLHFG